MEENTTPMEQLLNEIKEYQKKAGDIPDSVILYFIKKEKNAMRFMYMQGAIDGESLGNCRDLSDEDFNSVYKMKYGDRKQNTTRLP